MCARSLSLTLAEKCWTGDGMDGGASQTLSLCVSAHHHTCFAHTHARLLEHTHTHTKEKTGAPPQLEAAALTELWN